MTKPNGKEKLIAKVQHFYDILNRKSEYFADQAIITNAVDLKNECAALMSEYAQLAEQYKDIFKDFLYSENERSEN